MNIEQKIAKRANKLLGYTVLDTIMDLFYCIKGGCEIDLKKLSQFDDFNFAHDIVGIRSNLNRKTYKLENGFLPRCAINK